MRLLDTTTVAKYRWSILMFSIYWEQFLFCSEICGEERQRTVVSLLTWLWWTIWNGLRANMLLISFSLNFSLNAFGSHIRGWYVGRIQTCDISSMWVTCTLDLKFNSSLDHKHKHVNITSLFQYDKNQIKLLYKAWSRVHYYIVH